MIVCICCQPVCIKMQCLVSSIPFSISVYGFSRLSSAAREKILGVYRDFGQCTGENWSPVQGYDSNRLAGMKCTIY